MKILKLLILIILLSGFGFYYFWYQVNSTLDSKAAARNFSIPKGYSVKSVGEKLKNENIIKSDKVFYLYARLFRKNANMQAGEYNIGPNQSIKQIVEVLASGQTADKESTIKIIEGWSAKEIDKYLAKNSILKEGDFTKISNQPIKEYVKSQKSLNLNFVADLPDEVGSEGFLFPDTYKIFKDSNGVDIVNRMLLNFDKKLTKEMRDDIKKQKKTLYDIIIMASIIEKEVKLDPTGKSGNHDAKVVSGIFWRRIGEWRQLESCATLAYILGVNKPQYTVEDTNIDSPYNTYKNFGLPPGPICNPGFEAIKAAIYPEASEYNFFLNDISSKQTIFSKTFDEHIKNKAKYLK